MATASAQPFGGRRARDLGLQVVEALRPHLAHAAYVGFTHAGEPLVAPALVPFLEALAEARAGRPTVVHLLTNGMALGEAHFACGARAAFCLGGLLIGFLRGSRRGGAP